MFGSRTSIHVEDGFLSTYNFMLFGVPKIWYIVPKRHSHIFQKFLMAQNLFDTRVSKNCYVKAFGEGRMVIPMDIVEKFEIAQFVQYPGTIVMSIPGEICHWTISCGFNIVESSKNFTTAAKDSLLSLKKMWMDFKSMDQEEDLESAVSIYFQMCQNYHLL